jgi:hypothetical protein
MKYTATCPKCNKEVSMFRILVAITPFSFICSHCHTRIYVKDITKKILALLVTFGLSTVFILQYLLSTGKFYTYVYLLIPALIIITMEVLTTLLVCNRARLTIKKSKSAS